MADGAAPHYLIRSGALEGFRDHVQEAGGDADALLARAGLHPRAASVPDMLIPVAGFRQVLELAAEATGIARFGLSLSQRQSLTKLGAVGYLATHAPSLRQALRVLGRHLGKHDTAARVWLEEDADICLLRLDQTDGPDTAPLQQIDLALGLVVKFIRSVLQPEWTPQAVYLRHARPADARLYARVFRCPVQFGAAVDGVDVARGDMDQALSTADAGLYRVMRDYLALVETRQHHPVSGRVRAIILSGIENGAPTLEQVARRLHMSRSALQRALRSEGQSFRALLEETRFALACRLLRNSDLSLAQIALDLGYCEAAVFTRAFRRMAGKTPSAWRQSAGMRT